MVHNVQLIHASYGFGKHHKCPSRGEHPLLENEKDLDKAILQGLIRGLKGLQAVREQHAKLL